MQLVIIKNSQPTMPVTKQFAIHAMYKVGSNFIRSGIINIFKYFIAFRTANCRKEGKSPHSSRSFQ